MDFVRDAFKKLVPLGALVAGIVVATQVPDQQTQVLAAFVALLGLKELL